MKNRAFYFLSLIILLSLPGIILGQDSSKQESIYPTGITAEYGFGDYAVTDEYISKEKYSGSLPYYKILWANHHENYVYHLSLNYQYSSEIKNNNVSTDIHQFTLNQGFLYPLPKFTMFNKDAYLYLGPSTELFVFYNKQNIAVAGFDYAQSFAILVSLGASSKLFYKLWKNFNLEGSLDFSLLSLGFRMIDNEEEDVSPVKILTLISGTNLVFSLGPRFHLFDNLSLKAAYLFQLTRIDSWEPLLSAGDNVTFTLTYGF